MGHHEKHFNVEAEERFVVPSELSRPGQDNSKLRLGQGLSQFLVQPELRIKVILVTRDMLTRVASEYTPDSEKRS